MKQWLEGGYTKSIPEQYVFLSEPDHIFVLPPPLWATPRKPAAFEFGEPGVAVVMAPFCPMEPDQACCGTMPCATC